MVRDDAHDDTVLSAIAFAAVGELLILCYSTASPSDAEWDVWIEREKRMAHRAVLVSTEGGSPNARQRARVAEATDTKGATRPPLALLTDSAAIRSIMTAFGWILGKHQPMKAFPRSALDEAMAWLGVPVPVDRVRPVVARLHASLVEAAQGARRSRG
jgi:hypothetical protein